MSLTELLRDVEQEQVAAKWPAIEARFQRARTRKRALWTGATLALCGLFGVFVWQRPAPTLVAGRELHKLAASTPAVEPSTEGHVGERVAEHVAVEERLEPQEPREEHVAPKASVAVNAPVVNTPPAPAVSARVRPLEESVAGGRTAGWMTAAQAHDYEGAFVQLGSAGIAPASAAASSVDELLLLADVVRFSGHPELAVAPLSRIARDFSSDRRASTAAFTLGKLHLDAGRANDASRAFERAISLGLPSALEESAYARRVEAYAKAGDTARAHAAREAYDAQFPTGAHRRDVERWSR